MRKTWNYFLVKPDRTEFYNVENFNGNMDLIDEALVNIESKKATKVDLANMNERVGNLEQSKATKNGNASENFNANEINASEVKVGGYSVYHSGRKPSKADIALGNVDNYSSSEIYDEIDNTGYKFMLQKGAFSLYSKLKNLIDTLTTNKAEKNGNSSENFSAAELNVNELKVNGNTVYHTGRKPSKNDIGLGNVDNLLSSSIYATLDSTGDKFVLQKALKALYDEVSNSVNNVAILGEPILTLCDTLPNANDFSWMDGGQLKKSDYPKLWARVEATINSAVQAITAGSMTYGVDYFGWYIGDTSEYFRKPNMNGTGHIIRPTSARFPGKYEADDNKSHSHTGSTSVSGDHIHTMWSESEGTAGGGRTMSYRSKSYSSTLPMDSAGSHSHNVTIINSGGPEVKMKNISGKYYCRLK